MAGEYYAGRGEKDGAGKMSRGPGKEAFLQPNVGITSVKGHDDDEIQFLENKSGCRVENG